MALGKEKRLPASQLEAVSLLSASAEKVQKGEVLVSIGQQVGQERD